MQELISILDRYTSEKITLGMSGADVYLLPEISAYFKIAPRNTFSDLPNEKNALEWLRGKATVPAVLGYEATPEADYLLTSAIGGAPLSDLLSADDSTVETQRELAGLAARELRRLHDVPIDNCPLDQTLDVRFARALKNIEYKLLSETDDEFAAGHEGKMPIDVYRELSGSPPREFDLVFTHGDACMPNMIVRDGVFAGFIDLDGAGVADRYTDIAVFLWSFNYNCRVKVDVQDTFCRSYGIDRLDPDKMKFYLQLDNLF